MPESLSIDADQSEADEAYPIKITLRHLTKPQLAAPTSNGDSTAPIPNGLFRSNLLADTTDTELHEARGKAETFTEEVRAKYMVGCDGAHSWTRRQIRSVMEGEQTDFIW